MATIDELLSKAAEVRNERGAGQNTAVRIGDVLLCAAALIQALQEGLSSETAARSGGDSGLSGQIAAEAAARQSADSGLSGQIAAETTARQNADSSLGGQITAEATARQGAVLEVMSRLLGTSAVSSAYTDAFRLLGRYEDAASLNAALDAIGATTSSETESKNVGWVRAFLGSIPFYVLSSVDSWSERRYSQIVIGGVGVTGSGTLINSPQPGLYGRKRDGSSWTAWVPLGGGGGDLSNYLTKTEAQTTYALKSVVDALLTYITSGSGVRGAVTFNGDKFGIGSSAWITKFYGDVSFGEGNMPKLIEFLAKASVVFRGMTILSDNSYLRKNGWMYPLSHPDLNTQGSILPQRFGNLKIYEKLVYIGVPSGSNTIFLPSDAMPREAMPIRAALFGTTGNGTNGLMDGGNLFFGNDCWVYYNGDFAETGSLIYSDAYILVQYYLPEGGYYY